MGGRTICRDAGPAREGDDGDARGDRAPDERGAARARRFLTPPRARCRLTGPVGFTSRLMAFAYASIQFPELILGAGNGPEAGRAAEDPVSERWQHTSESSKQAERLQSSRCAATLMRGCSEGIVRRRESAERDARRRGRAGCEARWAGLGGTTGDVHLGTHHRRKQATWTLGARDCRRRGGAEREGTAAAGRGRQEGTAARRQTGERGESRTQNGIRADSAMQYNRERKR